MANCTRRGHFTTKPCDVCDGHKNNQVDSWFCITTCDDHADVPPAYIKQARNTYMALKEICFTPVDTKA